MKLNFKKMFAILLSIMLIVCALPNSLVMAESTGNVAKIGDTEYATLADALDVAQDGDTIVLLQDITSPIYGIGGGLNIKKAITLDLGGKTITDGWIMTEKNVTVQNGKLVNTTQAYPLVAKYGSTLTVTNLHIKDSKSEYAIYVQDNCSLVFNNSFVVLTSSTRDIYAIRGGKNSNITINSGEITVAATGKKAYGIYCSNDNANVTVNGGNITTSGSGYNYAINTYGNITVNGGNIVTGADGNGNFNYALYSKSDITVSGGSITTNGNFGYAFYAQGTEQTVTITGGEFKSKTETNLIKAGYSTKLTATIEGGEFTGYNATLLNGGSNVSSVSVSGGTFDALNESYIEEGATVIVAGKTYTKTEGTVTEVFVPAKVNGVGYATFAEALVAANGMTDDVVVEINGKVEYTDATPNLTGAYDSITFIGNTEDAEISITRNGSNGYISGVGDDCTVNFENLILSKPAGFYANDAGYMNMAFSVYRVGEVNYTNCTFPNGACAAGCPTTYTECTFEKSHEKYALWAYGTEVAIDDCFFDDDRGIKMYAEGLTKTTELTVTNSDFSKLTGKPAIVATCGKSITLLGNTYSAKGVLELEDNGSSNGIKIDSTDTVTCISDNYPNGCGLIVDGKIYRSVAEAAAVATSGSTVTLLHNSTETVEFVEGVVLNKNGFTADSVTVKAPASVAQVGGVEYATLDEAIAAANNGDVIKLISDITLTDTVVFPAGLTVTLDLGEYTISQTKECTESYSMIKNNGNLTITGNGKISFKDTGAGDPEFHWGAYTLSNHGTLVVESGIIENLSEQNTPGNIVHMYCAIQQGWGAVSTTINGGTISTPTYRSVRSNCGALIINGGNFEGQVWVQPNQGDATIKITGGTFAPKGGDGSSVFLTNVGENNTIAAAEISGGTFTTKVGSSNAATLPMTVTGGTFAVAIPENWCADGFIPKDNGDGTYGVKVGKYVAEVDGIGYETFEEALAAAKEGDTIKLVADVYEPTMTLVLPVGVSLDLQTYKLTVLYLVGFNGSHILGDNYQNNGTAYGQLVVAKNKVIMPNEACAVETENGIRYVMPIWDDENDCFVFGRFMINETGLETRGFFIDEENNRLRLQFKYKGNKAAVQDFIENGVSDNALRFIVRITWISEYGDEIVQDYKYSDEMVIIGSGEKDFGIVFEGYKECTNITVTAMLVSSTGVIVSGETHTVNTQN